MIKIKEIKIKCKISFNGDDLDHFQEVLAEDIADALGMDLTEIEIEGS